MFRQLMKLGTRRSTPFVSRFAFLPVVTEDRIFKGIITRKELLKVNFMVHELERRNILSPKIEELKEQIDIVS